MFTGRVAAMGCTKSVDFAPQTCRISRKISKHSSLQEAHSRIYGGYDDMSYGQYS